MSENETIDSYVGVESFTAKMVDVTNYLKQDDAGERLEIGLDNQKWIDTQIIAGLVRIVGSERLPDYVSQGDATDFANTLKDFLAKQSDHRVGFSIVTSLMQEIYGKQWDETLGDLKEEWKTWAVEQMEERVKEVGVGDDISQKQFVADRVRSIMARADDSTSLSGEPDTFADMSRLERLSELMSEYGLDSMAEEGLRRDMGNVVGEG